MFALIFVPHPYAIILGLKVFVWRTDLGPTSWAGRASARIGVH